MNLFQGIDMESLKDSFVIMGEGMFGILFVLIIIALIVLLLSKATKERKKDDDDSE